jgi:hypothetical protein
MSSGIPDFGTPNVTARLHIEKMFKNLTIRATAEDASEYKRAKGRDK